VVRQTASQIVAVENPLAAARIPITFAALFVDHPCVRVVQLSDAAGRAEARFRLDFRSVVPTAPAGGSVGAGGAGGEGSGSEGPSPSAGSAQPASAGDKPPASAAAGAKGGKGDAKGAAAAAAAAVEAAAAAGGIRRTQALRRAAATSCERNGELARKRGPRAPGGVRV
jgi:hypothetical protein